jgi:hypothetical protein
VSHAGCPAGDAPAGYPAPAGGWFCQNRRTDEIPKRETGPISQT